MKEDEFTSQRTHCNNSHTIIPSDSTSNKLRKSPRRVDPHVRGGQGHLSKRWKVSCACMSSVSMLRSYAVSLRDLNTSPRLMSFPSLEITTSSGKNRSLCLINLAMNYIAVTGHPRCYFRVATKACHESMRQKHTIGLCSCNRERPSTDMVILSNRMTAAIMLSHEGSAFMQGVLKQHMHKRLNEINRYRCTQGPRSSIHSLTHRSKCFWFMHAEWCTCVSTLRTL